MANLISKYIDMKQIPEYQGKSFILKKIMLLIKGEKKLCFYVCCVYISVCLCMCFCMCMSVYLCEYIWLYVCVCVNVSVCVYLSVCLCICVSLCACLSVYVYVWVPHDRVVIRGQPWVSVLPSTLFKKQYHSVLYYCVSLGVLGHQVHTPVSSFKWVLGF